MRLALAQLDALRDLLIEAQAKQPDLDLVIEYAEDGRVKVLVVEPEKVPE